MRPSSIFYSRWHIEWVAVRHVFLNSFCVRFLLSFSLTRLLFWFIDTWELWLLLLRLSSFNTYTRSTEFSCTALLFRSRGVFLFFAFFSVIFDRRCFFGIEYTMLWILCTISTHCTIFIFVHVFEHYCEDNDADEISRVERNERKTAVVAKVRNAKQRESKNGERATRRGRKWFLRFEIFRVEFICIAIVWRYCMDGNNEITKCWVHWHRSVAMHLTPCASHASSVPHTLKYPARCLDA